ncbi:tight adherence protein C [Desulfitispora alkaliphila]|uniref:type II secretion system F family protein n=1 Tax=Desulfitispora alkaliphila TaxID=622674 RepID=UPI003D1C7D44
MDNLKYIILWAIFFSIFFCTLSLYYFFMRHRINALDRLGQLEQGKPKQKDIRQAELDIPFFQRVVRPVLAKLSTVTRSVVPAEKEIVLQKKIIMAGNPGNISPSEFTVLQYAIAAALTIITMSVSILLIEVHKAILLGVASALVGYLLPVVYLNKKTQARNQDIRDQLPDVLDLLTISVEAGLGFDGALVKVTEKKEGVLSQEFLRLLQEIKKGKARRAALRDMANRCNVGDLSAFIGAVIQADQLGVSISNVLRLQAEQMRLKRRQLAEETAMKAPVKMLIPLVFFIFPTIFVVLLGPAAIQIINTLIN